MDRTYKQLSLEDRCEIARLRDSGLSIRQIAAALDRAPSTISRELHRNAGARKTYKPAQAGERAWSRRWRGSRMMRRPDLRKHVLGKLKAGWSPQQIAGRLALEGGPMRISHESIYRFIDAQIRRTKNYNWRLYLPRAKSKRGRARRAHKPMEHIKDRVCISDRPDHVETRLEHGHWEADLLHPRKAGAAVLVAQERTSRFVLMAKQAGKHAKPIAERIKLWFSALPSLLRRTLTNDNGPEFFLHHELHAMGVKTFFCKPHSPWQKGGVENLNGRLRRYIPRGTDPDSFSESDLFSLACRFNTTPRQCLGFKTPAEIFFAQALHLKSETTLSPLWERRTG
jgi:transposase, IS30 family